MPTAFQEITEPQFAWTLLRARKSIGDTLKTARRAFGLTIEEIAEDLKIRTDILSAIEEGNNTQKEELLYRTLMVKTYAEYLGVDWSSIADEYNRESLYRIQEEKKIETSTKSVQPTDFVVAPRLFKHILLSICMIGISGYLMVLAGAALGRPALTVTDPSDNLLSPEKIIMVEGVVSPDARLSVNGEEVMKNKDGRFRVAVTLSEGVNYIAISAAKKYSKETVVTRTVLYEAPSIPLTINTSDYGKKQN